VPELPALPVGVPTEATDEILEAVPEYEALPVGVPTEATDEILSAVPEAPVLLSSFTNNGAP
jgi:hypothetical protein